MNQIKIRTLVFLIVALLKAFTSIANPVKDFCQKNNIHQKSVIIALSLADCAVCFTPPDKLLDGIRKTNREIPVYVVTDEDMADGEKNIFRSNFGTFGNSAVFITNQSTYQYMLSQRGGVPGICCVSESGEVLVFKHLKHDNLDDFFKTIKPDFEIFLVNKTELKSTFISPKKHDGAFFIKNSICLFHPGANVIAKYNLNGENIKNLIIDSLDIDYLQLAEHLFPEKLYKSSKQDYLVNHPKRNHLVRAINALQIGKDTLCTLMMITACGDTVLNNKPTKYERSFTCMFLFDSDLKYLGSKFFASHYEASTMNAYMRGAYCNNKFYLGRYDALLKEDVMAEYEMKNATLFFKKQFVLPKNPEVKNVIPAIPLISMSRNKIYITYYKMDNKFQVTSTKAYKLSTDTGTFSEEIAADILWVQMHSTKKENYILYTRDNQVKIAKGYNKNTKLVTECKEKLGSKAQNEDPLFFVIDGQLQEYAYSE